MRIVSYNILDGGEGRADPLAEVIEAQRPDVVALIEADFPPVVERIANRLKMDYITAQGSKHAVALLSRWPIRDSVNHAALHPEKLSGCFLETTIVSPDEEEWSISAIHLPAGALEADEDRREIELEFILNQLAARRNARTLMLGDFNSNSPHQRINPDITKPKTQEAWKANGGQLPRRVIQRLLDAGYIDTLNPANDVEDLTAGTGSFTTQHPGQRVDYIFAHGIDTENILSAKVEQDRLAKYASDHFPIFVELRP